MCAAVLALLVCAGVASAADPWRPVPQSCVGASSFGVCSVTHSNSGLWKAVVAPGGTHAYGLAWTNHTLLIMDRDPVTGAITQRAGAAGCVTSDPQDTVCSRATALINPTDVVISPDGAQVYVVGGTAITVFDRDPSTGRLTQKPGIAGCLATDASTGCAVARSTSGSTLMMSADGRHLYTYSATIGIFQRDLATGTLTQAPDTAGCVANGGTDGCASSHDLGSARRAALSPDGGSLYAPGTGNNTIVVLDRDPVSGALRQKAGPAGCVGAVAGCTPESRLVTPHAVTVSSDSRHLYASVAGSVLVFARQGDGSLAFQSCVNTGGTAGCSQGRNLGEVSYGAVSPDGQTLVVGNQYDVPGIAIFSRDASGNLSQPAGSDGCVSPTGAAVIAGVAVANQCTVQAALGTNGQMTFVDDFNLLAGSHTNSTMVAFKRDLYPSCVDQAFTVSQNVAAPLPFACTDRNSDPLTFTVTGAPIAGAVGAVDAVGARVFYNPFSGFLGSDVVRYRASSSGLTSNEAKMDINVVPPFVPTPPAPKPRMVNAGVSYNWSVKRTRHTFTRLTVRNLPVGSTVELRCTGKRCPLKSLKIKRSRKSTMNVLNAKALSGKNKKRTRFRSGQSVDVRIAAPGMNTKMLRFVLRTGVVAKHRSYCVPLGAKRAVRGRCP
ncbi:lactonase family protein [Solirubrobacter taibaiensis]|nr:lactonase family protein [Solirubrobacter taibaiensis]